jgi:predicted Zn-dependent protease with MMP-like domain
MEEPGKQRVWSRLASAAEKEVRAVLESLPAPVRREAVKIPVTYERKPNRDMIEDGIEEDILGLFVGEAFDETFRTDSSLPAQILLFLENIWDFAEHDSEIYREEVRRTYLHELGHFLGLDEDGLADRDLD